MTAVAPGQLNGLLERGTSPEFALLRPAAARDPYPAYRAIAAEGPIYRSPLGYWLVTGYDDCAALLRDPRLGALTDLALRPDVEPGRYPLVEELVRTWFLFADPPRHEQDRRGVATCTARAIRTAIDREVEPMAAMAVAAIDWSRPVDVVARLGQRYPMAVIGRVLGLPEDDLPYLRSLTVVLSECMEPFLGEAKLRKAEDAARRLRDYFTARDGGTGATAAGCVRTLLDSPDLPPGAGLAHAILLLTAGQETTVNLIGMGVLAMLDQGVDPAVLEGGPAVVWPAVEELLRFTSPIQLVVRRAREPIELHGEVVPAGELVWLVLAAANRDPATFAEPDRLDLARRPNPHIAFATGAHVCFGAALTRAEMRVLLPHLAPVLARVAVDPSSVVWQRKRTGRGLARLVVAPRAAGG